MTFHYRIYKNQRQTEHVRWHLNAGVSVGGSPRNCGNIQLMQSIVENVAVVFFNVLNILFTIIAYLVSKVPDFE